MIWPLISKTLRGPWDDYKFAYIPMIAPEVWDDQRNESLTVTSFYLKISRRLSSGLFVLPKKMDKSTKVFSAKK